MGAPPIQGLLETIASPSPMTDGSKVCWQEGAG